MFPGVTTVSFFFVEGRNSDFEFVGAVSYIIRVSCSSAFGETFVFYSFKGAVCFRGAGGGLGG